MKEYGIDFGEQLRTIPTRSLKPKFQIDDQNPPGTIVYRILTITLVYRLEQATNEVMNS